MAEYNPGNKIPDIKTLEDSVLYFDLSSHLQLLENSLEDLRKNKQSEEDHDKCFKEIDKEIQKLSLKYHPDKVKNRGGTEQDVATAQKLQTAINSTRTALQLLNSAFLEDIRTDHKFGFYTKLNIDFICNEYEMQNQIFEIMLKIGVISSIKQKNIISEIGKFLIASKSCVRSYFDRANDFEMYRDRAFNHLICCIEGFEKLCAELEEVKYELKIEQKKGNMISLIDKMARDSKRDFFLLKSLKKSSKEALKGKYNFFSPPEAMDSYFILPLVSYMNVILMCNVMVRSDVMTFGIPKVLSMSIASLRNFWRPEIDRCDNVDLCFLKDLYYLASYYSGVNYFEKEALNIIVRNATSQKFLNREVNKDVIKLEFNKELEKINERLEHNFKVEDYTAIQTNRNLILKFKKCMKTMSQLKRKEQAVSEDIKQFQKESEIFNKRCEELIEMKKDIEELNQKVMKSLEELEEDKKLMEQQKQKTFPDV